MTLHITDRSIVPNIPSGLSAEVHLCHRADGWRVGYRIECDGPSDLGGSQESAQADPAHGERIDALIAGLRMVYRHFDLLLHGKWKAADRKRIEAGLKHTEKQLQKMLRIRANQRGETYDDSHPLFDTEDNGMAKKAAGGAATAEKPKDRKQDAKAPLMVIPGDFGNVNLGDGVASVRFTASRDHLNLDAADEGLCGKRLTGKIVQGDTDQIQQRLFGDLNYEVAGVFDVKALNLKPKTIGFGLSFPMEDTDLTALSHFAKRRGGIIVHLARPLDEAGPDESEEEEDDEE